MDRRELLMLGGLALAGAPEAGVAQVQPNAAWTSFMHVWTDASGVSHAEHVPLNAKVKSVPITQISIRTAPEGYLDWRHPASPQFVVTLAGELEVEVSDGTRLGLPASRLTYLEDMTGKGHATRTKNVLNLYMQTAPGFDARLWARGEA
jgi:quercetin dioxygenase-like cupin family protein